MKHAFTTFIMLFSLIVSAQKRINVTIIGTAHSFQKQYQPRQSFDKVKLFIQELNPDIICIEAIPTDDTLSLKEIWPNTMKRADRLRDTLRISESEFEKKYSELELIAAKAFATYDFWNGYYHWFQALQNDDTLGYLNQFYKDQSKSEYGLMVFPAAQELGIKHLYGIDYRNGEKKFLETNSKVMKKLLFNFKWKPIRVYLKTQKKYRKAEKEGRLIEFINGDEFQGAFSNLIDDLPNRLPKAEEAAFIKSYWLNRNKHMADRIISTAEEQGAENVLLTVGSAHVTHIKRVLEDKGHSVTTYGQILNIKNH